MSTVNTLESNLSKFREREVLGNSQEILTELEKKIHSSRPIISNSITSDTESKKINITKVQIGCPMFCLRKI